MAQAVNLAILLSHAADIDAIIYPAASHIIDTILISSMVQKSVKYCDNIYRTKLQLYTLLINSAYYSRSKSS